MMGPPIFRSQNLSIHAEKEFAMRQMLIMISLAFLYTCPILASDGQDVIRIVADESNPETVFNWSKNRCFAEHIPDSPARAFRSPSGRVNLYATHYINSPLIGTTLDNVRPACDRHFSGSMNSAAEIYDARIWLQTFYSSDNGKTIYSLASSDYHGMWFNNCEGESNIQKGCWWNAIVLVRSTDGGITFKKSSPPDHIVARSPHKFSKSDKGPVGFLTTSNIIMIDNYYYALFNTAKYKEQKQGNCLARSDNLRDPDSWRVWNGLDYTDTFYRAPTNENISDDHACKTLDNLPYKIRSLLWHAPSKNYIAVFERFDIENDASQKGDIKLSYSWSSDLIKWHKPKDIVIVKARDSCKGQAAAAYPSIIDGDSKDENFGTVGNNAYLYYTRFNFSDGCRPTLDRDLVRIPIKITLEKI